MANDLAKLNRMRVNAGLKELGSWKGTQKRMDEVVAKLESQGITDALPGAVVNAKPITTDPEIAAALPQEEEPTEENTRPDPPTQQMRPQLARGIDTDTMARNSRQAVKDARSAEKKAAGLSKEDKKQIKDEAKARGKVDAKKDPEKAKRQQKHIEDKKTKREASGGKTKTVGDNEITVAEIARKLSIDPKVARAKLRRHEDKITKLHTKGQDRWTFPKSAEKTISDILK